MDSFEGRPLVSVVMPAYNAENYIAQAIASVQAQSVTQWQLLVIDDCSQDGTCAIVEALSGQDSRIRLFRNEENMGTARSRNRGLELSQGQYVAFLDSDDIWHSQKLERQIAAAQAGGADVVFTSYAIIGNDGQPRCNDFVVPRQTDFRQMLRKNVVGCSTVLISAAAAEKYRFQEDVFHEDYALWLTMIRDGAVFVGVPEVLVSYRYHSTSRAANKGNSAKSRWVIYRKLLGLSVGVSGWYLVQYALNGLWKYRRK